MTDAACNPTPPDGWAPGTIRNIGVIFLGIGGAIGFFGHYAGQCATRWVSTKLPLGPT